MWQVLRVIIKVISRHEADHDVDNMKAILSSPLEGKPSSVIFPRS